MGTIGLQTQIKDLLAMLKWSQKRLAREMYIERNDDDNEDQIRKYEEKIKKDLVRKTSKPQLLTEYLKFIYQHREFRQISVIKPLYLNDKALSNTMKSGMHEISKVVTCLVSEE